MSSHCPSVSGVYFRVFSSFKVFLGKLMPRLFNYFFAVFRWGLPLRFLKELEPFSLLSTCGSM